MKRIALSHPSKKLHAQLQLSGGKSETNRVLILKALYFPELKILGGSDCDDSVALMDALNDSSRTFFNVKDAGTAMRFLTAFYSIQKGEIELKGSDRMHQRPIGQLVDSLRELGAKITYLEQEGYPPLKIESSELKSKEIHIEAGVSSQFISALMMIGPKLKGGLVIKTKGFSVSMPYLFMTAKIMKQMGLMVHLDGDIIKVDEYNPSIIAPTEYIVEGDWSSASYWYNMVSLSAESEIDLSYLLHKNTKQGDSIVRQFYIKLGVQSEYKEAAFRLSKLELALQSSVNFNLIEFPDLAQTIAVTCAALNINAYLTGLSTLPKKETNRLLALKTELEKTGAIIEIDDSSLRIIEGVKNVKDVEFDSWGDHRMIMSLSALSLLDTIIMNDVEVVSKSYLSFWNDMEMLGFDIKVLD